MSTADLEVVAEKIKKLLALGGSPNEAEAAVAMAKAHDLLTKYNLSIDEVTMEKAEVVEMDYMEGGRARKWKLILIQAICKYNYCYSYRSIRKTWGTVNRSSEFTLNIVGKEHNMAATKIMVDYILDAVNSLALKQRGSGKSEIESYKIGLADILMTRLRDLSIQEQSMNCNCKDLVIVEDAAIKNFLSNKNIKSRNVGLRVKDQVSYDKGRYDGSKINLNTQIGSTRSQSAVGLLK
jgi:hypothetical protein